MSRENSFVYHFSAECSLVGETDRVIVFDVDGITSHSTKILTPPEYELLKEDILEKVNGGLREHANLVNIKSLTFLGMEND